VSLLVKGGIYLAPLPSDLNVGEASLIASPHYPWPRRGPGHVPGLVAEQAKSALATFVAQRAFCHMQLSV